jgi:phosphoinositide-3-kinase, regulatory subunit 4
LGLISTFFLSPSRQWLTIGTNRGYVSSWDTRFKVPFREWRLPDQSVVHSMSAAGLSADGMPTSAFVAAGPGDFAEWSLESSRCTRLYRILSERTSKLPDLNPDSSPVKNDWGLSDLERPPRSTTRVRALAASNPATSMPASVGPSAATAKNPAPSADGLGFVISAGVDKKIRYWDIANAKTSYVISGLEKLEPKPVYHSYSAMEDTVSVYEEMPGPYEEPIRAYDDTGLREPNLDPPATAHRDTILDLKILESPSRLLISCSRDGVIKVWK